MMVGQAKGEILMAVRNYTVIYQPAEEGGYYAHIPVLDVTTEGETLSEAKLMARDAIESTLACLKELNLPIPEEIESEHIEVAS
jgi:predicted RNase H-like HicB family nuclease